jgi:hypothetical protein
VNEWTKFWKCELNFFGKYIGIYHFKDVLLQVASVGGNEKCIQYFNRKTLKRRYHLERPTHKQEYIILKKGCVRMLIGLMWLRKGTSGVVL